MTRKPLILNLLIRTTALVGIYHLMVNGVDVFIPNIPLPNAMVVAQAGTELCKPFVSQECTSREALFGMRGSGYALVRPLMRL